MTRSRTAEAYCRHRAEHRHIEGDLVSALPTYRTGKILKAELPEPYWATPIVDP
jgi:hypothetical protein